MSINMVKLEESILAFTAPKSGKGYCKELVGFLKENYGKLATIIGRYFAMDLDK